MARAQEPSDILLLGSSFTAVDLLPGTIADELKRMGMDARVANLALYGSREFENAYLLRKIKPTLRGAKIAIIDMRDWTVGNPYGGLLTPRGAQWHDLTTYVTILRYMISTKQLDARLLLDHTLSTLWHYVPLGRALGDKFEDPVPEIQSSRRSGGEFEHDGISYEQMIEVTQKLRFMPGLQVEFANETRARISWLESFGVDVFVFLAPSPTAVNWRVENTVRSVAPEVSFLNLDSIDLYPELYKRENRWDYSHLNGKGAELCSRYAARQLAASMKRSNPIR